jgi:CubicO group peptidase (beta-lactamase class C family)
MLPAISAERCPRWRGIRTKPSVPSHPDRYRPAIYASVGLARDRLNFLCAGAGLVSTAADYLKFAQMVVDSGTDGRQR